MGLLELISARNEEDDDRNWRKSSSSLAVCGL
jgi:hypothetical protein